MQRILLTCAIIFAASSPALSRAGDREDKATAEQIAIALRDSGAMQDYSVGVKYKNGTIWLNGRVTSEQQMQAALEVLSEIEGIEQIVNGLEVAQGSSVKQASVRSTPLPVSTAAVEPVQKASANTAPRKTAMPKSQAPSNGEATPVGYHRLAARHAARHAGPVPTYVGASMGAPPAYDQPHMPRYAWPSQAAYPNYAAVTYPKQYSPTAWPFIGPFYPYPQVPMGWRKVALEWDDGWWFLDFYDRSHH
jgi:hypothetical protein